MIVHRFIPCGSSVSSLCSRCLEIFQEISSGCSQEQELRIPDWRLSQVVPHFRDDVTQPCRAFQPSALKCSLIHSKQKHQHVESATERFEAQLSSLRVVFYQGFPFPVQPPLGGDRATNGQRLCVSRVTIGRHYTASKEPCCSQRKQQSQPNIIRTPTELDSNAGRG